MKYRITARGTDIELRGVVDGDINIALLADAMDGLALVIASPVENDFDPFREQELRELHHFETEQMLDAVRAEVNRPFTESPEFPSMMPWLAATLERIAKIVGAPTEAVQDGNH